ncbi:MAG: hypothetical protein AAGH19_09260 [Pseudomonadota bacterium]
MRFSKLTACFVTLLLLVGKAEAVAQDCEHLSGIVLGSQSEVDQFQTTYGPCERLIGSIRIDNGESFDRIRDLYGLTGLSEIVGSLTIEGNRSLRSLVGLETLRAIGGDFRVSSNINFINFGGVPSLTHIGGDFSVSSNEKLETFNGLSTLTHIGGDLSIERSPLVGDLWGFRTLETIGGDLDIESLRGLTDLNGLSSLNEIGGLLKLSGTKVTTLRGLSGVSIHRGVNLIGIAGLESLEGLDGLSSDPGEIWISNCDLLEDLSGLPAIRFIGRDLSITHNDLLTSLSPLESLTRVGRDLKLESNRSLEHPDSLSQLEHVGRNFTIESMGLKNLDGLASLERVDGLFLIVRNSSLTDLMGLTKLEEVYELEITQNPLLASLSGLGSLKIIGNGIAINENPSLKDLRSLQNLELIAGGVRLFRNTSLESLSGLEAVEEMDWLDIGSNHQLSDISALRGLRKASDGFALSGSPLVTNLAALSNLRGETGRLVVRSMDGLQNLDGFSYLEGAREVEIRFNDLLENLDGLAWLSEVTQLRVTNNQRLTDCTALAPVLGWPIQPHDRDRDRVEGLLEIRLNDDGAQSPNDCLGNYAPNSIGGVVDGDVGEGLIIRLNGQETLAVDAAGPFQFTNTLYVGNPYSVEILAQPSPPAPACSVYAGSGLMPNAPFNDIEVYCGIRPAIFSDRFEAEDTP